MRTDDTAAPVVVIASPGEGASVHGTLEVTLDVVDVKSGVASVELRFNDVAVATLLNPPFVFTVDTTKTSDGDRELLVIATDTKGNKGQTARTVHVANIGPSFSAIDVSPAIANAGAVVTIGLTSSEALPEPPVVSIGARTATLVSQEGLRYVFSYVPSGSEEKGTQSITIVGAGADGAPGSATASITFDFTPPTVAKVVSENDVPVVIPGVTFSSDVSGGESCDTCAATDGVCDDEWEPAKLEASGHCTSPAIACINGDTLTLAVRARDVAGNVATSASITRSCDTRAPAASALTIGGNAAASSVGASFSLQATFTAVAAPLVSCEYCKSVDATCGLFDWFPATLDGNGLCSVSQLSCGDNTPLVLSMRAKDVFGTFGAVPTELHRVCDRAPPIAGAVIADGTASFVRNGFSLSTPFFDLGSGVASCEYCASTAPVCTSFASASLNPSTNDCTATAISCSDGDLLRLTMRATDAVQSGNGTAPQITRTCDALPPTTPQLQVTGIEPHALAFTWTASVDVRSGIPSDGYEMLYGPSGGILSTRTNLSGTSMTLAGLPACTTEIVTISATDNVGNRTPQSNVQQARTRCGGDGTFVAGQAIASPGVTPSDMALADLNADAILDVVYVASNALYARMGTGTNGIGAGGFSGATSFALPGLASQLELGDFNDDGIVDAAVSTNGTNVQILLGAGSGGRGTGGFGAASFVANTADQSGIGVADFDGDRITDLFTVGNSAPHFLKGNGSFGRGNGTFSQSIVAGGALGSRLVVGDFFEDGRPDVAYISPQSNQICTAKNSGSGFVVSCGIAGIAPGAIATADFDDDDILDLAIADSGATSVRFFKGNGTNGLGIGTFTFVPTSVNLTAVALDLKTTDTDRDGFVDLVVGTAAGVNVHHGTGDFGFDQGTSFGPGGLTHQVAVGDVDDNGVDDLVFDSSPSLQVMLGGGKSGRGNGAFAAAVAVGNTNMAGHTVTDVNDDGLLDVVALGLSSGVETYRGGIDAVGSLRPALSQPTLNTGPNPRQVAAADLTNDGIVDLIIAHEDGTGLVLAGYGSSGRATGTFLPSQLTYGPQFPFGIAVADFTLDRIVDLVLPDSDDNVIYTFAGHGSSGVGDGTFTSLASLVAVPQTPTVLVSGDMNDDKIPDIVVGDLHAATIEFIAGTTGSTGPSGPFALPQSRAVTAIPSGLVHGDFNRDAVEDLAITFASTNQVGVWLGIGANGQGGGSYTTAGGSPFTVAGGPTGIAAADLDSDGILDLVVVTTSGTLVVLKGQGSGGRGNAGFVALGSPYPINGTPQTLSLADLDQDGILDAIVATDSGLRVFYGLGTYQ